MIERVMPVLHGRFGRSVTDSDDYCSDSNPVLKYGPADTSQGIIATISENIRHNFHHDEMSNDDDDDGDYDYDYFDYDYSDSRMVTEYQPTVLRWHG